MDPSFELTEANGRWYGRGAADCKGNILRVPPGTQAGDAARALVGHLHAVAPWGVRMTADIEAPGSGFQARTGGPAYRAIAAAIRS